MPAPTSATITLTASAPPTTAIAPGGKVTFQNGTASTITLHPPSCVSPSNSVQIPAGGSSQALTVNNSADGDYNYSYSIGAESGPVNGTIDVSL